MKQKAITYWLKAVAISIGLLGLAFFGGATAYASFWISAVICYTILFFFWRIVSEIGKDNSFSLENVKNFKCMAGCGVAAIIEYIAVIVIWLVNGEVELIPLSYTLLKIVFFILFVVLCYAMSKLVNHAYEIKQENELTI